MTHPSTSIKTNQPGDGYGSPVSLYLHIPFCDHKCNYCDFNSYAGMERLIPAFTDALVHELEVWAPGLNGRPTPTVFFGGGTPSLMPLEAMSRVMTTIRRHYALAPNAEVTLEANPGTVDLPLLTGLRDLGINRLSLGVQSLDDRELAGLDRIHDAAAAVDAYRLVRAAGFDNVNLDLIFGLAGQTLESWVRTLERALRLAPEHLSLYALTIEEGTGLASLIARGKRPSPDPDLQAAMYERTQDLLAAAGYVHYEISNWALPGHECRHNLVYWRDGDWLGVGPGAHSHIDGARFGVMRPPVAYINAALEAPRPGRTVQERMPQIDLYEEPDAATARADAAMLALRLSEGLDEAAFERRFGLSPDAAFPNVFDDAVAGGLAERSNGVIRLTRAGRLLSNEVFVGLLL